MNLRRQWQNLLRRWWLSSPQVSIDRTATLEAGLAIRPGMRDTRKGTVSIGPGAHLAQGAVLDAWGGNITLGEQVFVGPYAVIYGQGGVIIGDATLISMHCRILSSNHRIPIRDRRILWEGDELLPTRIGCDVWLGAGVTMLGGVTIGDGCVVGAGAVVTKDLPPYSIAMGVPARVVAHRSGST